MASRWRGRRPPSALLAALGYLALAVAETWPLVTVLPERLAGNRPLDAFVYVWALWWVPHALLVLRANPFTTTMLFYPEGAPLYLHTFMPLSGVLAAPVGLAWGHIVAYNVTAIGGLALAGWATFRLARRWLPPAGAALSGLIFAAAPWVLHQLRIGHLNLMQVGWLPLALWALLRAVERGRWRDRLLAVAALLAATLVETQFALFLVVAGAVLAVERLATAGAWPEARRRLVTLASVALLFGLLLSPLALAAARQAEEVPPADQAKFRAEQIEYSADLLAFVVPQVLHPLWGRAITSWQIEHPLGSVTEGRVSLGLVPLALTLLTLIWRRPGQGAWWAVGLVGLLLALGPRLHVGGADTGLPGPYALVGALPLIGVGRTPARFAVLAALAVALLAGFGAVALHTWLARRGGARLARAGAVAVAGLVVFELLPLPYPTLPLPSLALARQVAAVAGDGTVLELPYHADDSPRMLYQTVHQRPIFGGYLTRPVERPFLDRAAVINGLMVRAAPPEIAAVGDPLAVLATHGIRAIVVYRPPYYRPDVGPEAPPANEALMRQRVQSVLRVAGPDWEDATGAVYRVPPADPAVVLTPWSGWHAPEPWSGAWMRWMPAAASLRLDQPTPAEQVVEFTAWSFHRPRTLIVRLDGQTLATLPLTPEPRGQSVWVPPGARARLLTLTVVEGAEAPASLGLGADVRPLAVGLAGLRVAPAR